MAEEKREIPFRKLRPKDMPKDAWCEIIDAWENGLSDREAAFRASRACGQLITEAEVKRMVEGDENIGMLRDQFHADIISEAKLNIRESIMRGDISTSKWYLERKAAEEFSTKAALAFEGGVMEISIDERKKQMDEFMRRFSGKSGDSETVGDTDEQGT